MGALVGGGGMKTYHTSEAHKVEEDRLRHFSESPPNPNRINLNLGPLTFANIITREILGQLL